MPVNHLSAHRTTVDDIFDFLHEQISSLALLPGDKISEADIAARFGVSRQPVRDAFSRLANLDLLLIRPQRATEVRRFSMREIVKSRFVRLSVETEVLRRAAKHCTPQDAARLDAAIARQEKAVNDLDVDGFGALDYKFHQELCHIAHAEFAFDVIMAEKTKVDRLCLLGLSKQDRMPELVEDHRAIANAIKDHNPELAVKVGTHHLSRLDETIKWISETNENYFDPNDG